MKSWGETSSSGESSSGDESDASASSEYEEGACTGTTPNDDGQEVVHLPPAPPLEQLVQPPEAAVGAAATGFGAAQPEPEPEAAEGQLSSRPQGIRSANGRLRRGLRIVCAPCQKNKRGCDGKMVFIVSAFATRPPLGFIQFIIRSLNPPPSTHPQAPFPAFAASTRMSHAAPWSIPHPAGVAVGVGAAAASRRTAPRSESRGRPGCCRRCSTWRSPARTRCPRPRSFCRSSRSATASGRWTVAAPSASCKFVCMGFGRYRGASARSDHMTVCL